MPKAFMKFFTGRGQDSGIRLFFQLQEVGWNLAAPLTLRRPRNSATILVGIVALGGDLKCPLLDHLLAFLPFRILGDLSLGGPPGTDFLKLPRDGRYQAGHVEAAMVTRAGRAEAWAMIRLPLVVFRR